MRILGTLLRLYQRSGLQWLARTTGLLRALRLARADEALPRLISPLGRGSHNPKAASRGTVALFSGCVSSLADAATQHATVQLLNALNYRVEIPGQQTCCGALFQHSGDTEQAARLARTNLGGFDADKYAAIITTASGCSAHLVEYGNLYGGEDDRAPGFQARIQDITHFLAQAEWPDDLALAPLPATVAVHDPCTLRHGLKQHREVYRLLERIPSLQLVPLDASGRCCGAAGSYFLTQPATADALRQPHIDTLKTLGVSTLVSSNIGCALHLAAGIRAAGLDMEVIHPVTLLARQLS